IWHDTSLGLHQLQRAGNDAAEAVTTLGTQLEQAEALLKTASSAPAGAKDAVDATSKQMADLRRRLGVGQTGGPGGGGGFGGQNPNVRARIGQLKGQIMNSTSLPTAMQVRAATEAREDLTKVVQEINDLIAALPQLYDTLGAPGLKPAALTAIRIP
ncbi:MAG: hypothetical protein OEW19_19120, partial [Acidobacteriota bacterium]|nr:hypothetical protein [Acidobacteriota bacterium]